MSCLCLGPSGSGKTLLIKNLQGYEITEITIPIETVGTSIQNIKQNPSSSKSTDKSSSKNMEISIREVGGSMAPLWPSYYNSSIKYILFVIDSNNLFQVSISTVMLMEMISHEKLTKTKIIVVLSKIDLASRKKLNHLKFMMRLDTIIKENEKRLSIFEISSQTGEGVEEIRSKIFS